MLGVVKMGRHTSLRESWHAAWPIMERYLCRYLDIQPPIFTAIAGVLTICFHEGLYCP